ncbi:hypothetical protein XBP1_2460002 [Xenorhabdus bovienii str. puntauvense]|uniref:Uncharacterized protein n=1 Tax=Xenorhabdus bovienii str. puntauvense TaxID=1398201 RepID=A0A077NDX3_XENBV|nr:hypothetical protein XBP1_2460002 [Xenorhabdus bovienii str. puntauvense]
MVYPPNEQRTRPPELLETYYTLLQHPPNHHLDLLDIDE